MIIGPFTLRPLNRRVEPKGETASGRTSLGSSALSEVTGAGGLRLTVRDTTWANGERDVVACERHTSPELFDTLIERLRLPILDHNGLYAELRQARLRPNGRAGLFNADLVDLDQAAGVNVEATLVEHGAMQVATRQDLLGDNGPARTRFGVRFPAEATEVPLIAYVLTRICPVAAGISA